MCDCYCPKCELCEDHIPVHIEDYHYPREDVQVFCGKHIPEDKVTVFVLTEDEDWDPPDYRKGYKCGIRLQDGGNEPFSVGVCPNIDAPWDIQIKQ